MRHTGHKTDFHLRKDVFRHLPSLVFNEQEQTQMEEKLSEAIQRIPGKLYDLLGPSASFCQFDEVINELQQLAVPNTFQGFFNLLLLDYYTCNLDLPSTKRFEKKLGHPTYRSYVIHRVTDELLSVLDAIYIAQALPRIRIDQQAVNVQLETHPYLSTKLTIELPIQKNWYLTYAQQAWMQVKTLLDNGQPAIIYFVTDEELLRQPSWVVFNYEIPDSRTIVLGGINAAGKHSELKLTFQEDFQIEVVGQEKTDSAVSVHTIHYVPHTLSLPPATSWLERQFHPIITNRHLRRLHRRVKVG
ncbi:hypothetical protein [Marinoscillum furvescens]|uniref:Uncharacterized protein n=1 Tax=Marinoscillum furvescens DSM 4134 TaxID=1122208 RepID=A0A3D9L9I5_MARFU|nr:hypothetical protein [Marinoscillum furvescens]REE01722.1 hypothetical protein C7460_103239 [Marinoscillum furvescens DSM 4134]